MVSAQLCEGPDGREKNKSAATGGWCGLWEVNIKHYLKQTVTALKSRLDVSSFTWAVLVSCGKVNIFPVMSLKKKKSFWGVWWNLHLLYVVSHPFVFSVHYYYYTKVHSSEHVAGLSEILTSDLHWLDKLCVSYLLELLCMTPASQAQEKASSKSKAT